MSAGEPARWVELYEAARVESDRDRLAERIQLAESAILARLEELEGPSVERYAIYDALRVLSELRQKSAGRQ